VQLGFASLLMDGTPSTAALGELRLAIERERDTLGELARVLSATPDPDVARVSALRRIRSEHPEARVIAFSEFASTITSLYSAMRADAGVGMLTAREARIASGRIARDELLARFAPVAQQARAAAAHESITLLLATDLLSEGVNLQDASVVVHLDLPWNPARLAQRVGRLRRPGAPREVRTYLLAPPARAGMLLDADARLRRKLEAAERLIGRGIGVLPALARESASSLASNMPQSGDASATEEGAFTAHLERWSAASPPADAASGCIVAGVAAGINGWLAALDDGRVVSSTDGRISDSPSAALRVANLVNGKSRLPDGDETNEAFADLYGWLGAERVATMCGLDAYAGPCRRAMLDWLDTLTRELPRHERAGALPLVGQLRAALRTSLPLGAERLLAGIALKRAVSAHHALQSAQTIIEDCSRGRIAVARRDTRVIALIMIGRAKA